MSISRPSKAGPLTPDQCQLAEQYIALVGIHIRKHVTIDRRPRRHKEFDDIFQEGCLGLIKAAATYSDSSGMTFPAFAFPRIRSAVWSCLRSQFSLVRPPERPTSQDPPAIDPMPDNLRQWQPVASTDQGFAEAHSVRENIEMAVELALEQLAMRRWTQRNPVAFMRRCAHERLLIRREDDRTPLRRLASDFGISSGRAAAYEKQLVEAVKRQAEGIARRREAVRA